MHLNRRLFASAAVAAAITPLAHAQSPQLPDALRQRIAAFMAVTRAPACAIAVVKDGRLLAAEGFGFASVPFSAPATEQSLFHLGSVSKQFTAAVVVALAREGRIDLSRPVSDYVGDLPQPMGAAPVQALLTHTSGIPDYEGLPGFEPDRSIGRADFIRGVANLPHDFPPGTAWLYSNTAYVLLGYLIADVTDQTYHEAVRTRLLQPAGLTETRFDDATSLIPGRVEPYVLDGDDVRHATRMDGDFSGWPDGRLLMSARDAARWEIALQNHIVVPRNDLNLLTRPSVLSTDRSTGYGMGWFTDRTHGRDVQYHSGSVPGFLAFYWRAPSSRTAAVALVNLESGPTASALRGLAQELCEWASPASTFLSLSPVRDQNPALTREALALLTRGETPIAPERLSPELAIFLPDRSGIPRSNTPPASLALVETYTERNGVVRRYRAAFPGRVVHLAFAYDRSERIYRVRVV